MALGASMRSEIPNIRGSLALAGIQPEFADDNRNRISTAHGDSPSPVRAVIIVTNGRFRLYIITDTSCVIRPQRLLGLALLKRCAQSHDWTTAHDFILMNCGWAEQRMQIIMKPIFLNSKGKSVSLQRHGTLAAAVFLAIGGSDSLFSADCRLPAAAVHRNNRGRHPHR